MSTSSIMQGTLPRSGGRAALRDRRGLALAIVLGAQLMIVLDLTVVNIALPDIAHGLHFSAASLSWVLSAYTLTFGGLLLLGGRAGDILGRRQVFMAGGAPFPPAPLAGGAGPARGGRLLAPAARGVGGGGWRVRLPGGAGDDPRQLRGRPRARPRAGHLHRRGHGRRVAGPGARRRDHRVGVLALGAVRQRADRRAGRPRLPALPPPNRPPAGPLRRRRGADLHGRDGLARVRHHPRRLGRLERQGGPDPVRRRGDPARRFPLPRIPRPAAG